MTIENDLLPFDERSAPSGAVRWTLADFLSTYRYWALFVATLIVAFGGQGAGLSLPVILMEAGASHREIGVFHAGVGLGWPIGAFLAFVVAPRHGHSALIGPTVAFAGVTAAFLFLPSLWSSAVLLTGFGLACGAAQGAFSLALAVFLLGGRPIRTDFGGALFLLSVPVLTANIAAPFLAVELYESRSGLGVLAGVAACMIVALVVILPARRLGFADAPRPRHRPLRPHRRSPLMVAAVLLTPAILLALLGLAFYVRAPFAVEAEESAAIATMIVAGVLCLGIAAIIYLGFWLYRIHGELAGAAPSQRLITPLTALLVALLVPFGLPVLLLALGDLLNDRAQNNGRGRTVSITWLTVWTLFLPPVAVAMIQNAANNSYAEATKAP